MIQWLRNPEKEYAAWEGFDPEAATRVRAFHETVPGYAPTPLHHLHALSEKLGIADFYIKDESARFGLNAFKGLGGIYCVASCLAERMGLEAPWSYQDIVSRKRESPVFATATDGNHGRGIAWACRVFGCPCHVFLPKGSAEERVQNIRKEGASAEVTQVDYDATVQQTAQRAQEEGWILVQDTAWEGYTEIPRRIMQGYLTLGEEIREQMPFAPTHIFLQAGVGSMAASLCAYFRALYGEKPVISIVESCEADCLFETAKAGDGKLHAAKGSMQTMMAGLCCGYPCLTAWEMLRKQADFFITIDDDAAALGMRRLARPLLSDPAVESGESGASAAGLVMEMMHSCPEAQEALGIGRQSVVLCISTEGATDRANYNRILRSEEGNEGC